MNLNDIDEDQNKTEKDVPKKDPEPFKVGPNPNIENAKLNLPKSKFKPDYFCPKYANYIWKAHAPNFIRLIVALENGDTDEIVSLTDSSIRDISDCLEDEEKTLDIVARYTNLAMHIAPNSMESDSTADQIFNGIKYMIVTLSFVHARLVFIQLGRKQYDAAEIYIMNFENRKWWNKAVNANKRFGGKSIDEDDLIYEILGQTFSTLKAGVFEGKEQWDMALKCFLGVPMELKLGGWRYRTWDDGLKCPERYFMTDDERMTKIRFLDQKWKEAQNEPKMAEINPLFGSYLERVDEDRDAGKMESIEKMMETGIFWATVKCPKCARNQTVQTTFFYNKCKMCRNIQVTALLGHLNVDAKYFQWLGKETSALDFSDDEVRKRERLEREQEELEAKKLREKEEIIKLLREKEAEVERLSKEEEYHRAHRGMRISAATARIRCSEARRNRDMTNQMLAEADKLLEETAAFQRARKLNQQPEPLSDEFKSVIKEERRGKNLGDSILENMELQNDAKKSDTSDEAPDLEEVFDSFPPESTVVNEEDEIMAALKAKAEDQENKLKNEKID